MSETADRYCKVADAFGARVAGVEGDGWDAPAPCDGWAARDVVDHLGHGAGFFLNGTGREVTIPSAADDPMATWAATRATFEAVLGDPEVAGLEIDSPFGRMTVEELIGRIAIADMLVHTWDLARATGQDETLDIDEVRRTMAILGPADEVIRSPGAFGPKVEVPADSDEQTQLIAFTGRTP
jgi:uncharacterized protein (TIGR03086 family)